VNAAENINSQLSYFNELDRISTVSPVLYTHLTLWRYKICPDVKNYKWRLNLVWHRMLYICTHMAPVGIKGLIFSGQFELFIYTTSVPLFSWSKIGQILFQSLEGYCLGNFSGMHLNMRRLWRRSPVKQKSAAVAAAAALQFNLIRSIAFEATNNKTLLHVLSCVN